MKRVATQKSNRWYSNRDMSKQRRDFSKKFVAIDANSLIHRAFHAFPSELTTSTGVQVNAVYGFTSMLLRVLDELNPKYLVCAFDMKEPTFRHTEFVEYKGKRKPTDHMLSEQFPLVKEVLRAFNIPILEHKGFEADDILATLAEYTRSGKWKTEGLETIIVTGDKDLFQVVGRNVKVWIPKGSFKDMQMYDDTEIRKRFGFGPEAMPDFKALVGDASDNIPGVKGIGEKSATEMIRIYGNLKKLYKNLDKINKRQRKLLVEGEESAVMSLHLSTVIKTVPFNIKLEDCLMRDFKREDLLATFQRYEFRSLINKIPDSVNDVHDVEQMGLFGGVNDAESDVSKAKNISKSKATVEEIQELAKDSRKSSAVIFLFNEDSSVMAGLEGRGEKDFPQKYYYGKDFTSPDTWKIINSILLNKKIHITCFGWETLWRKAIEFCSIEEKNSLIATGHEHILDIGLAAYHISSGQKEYSLSKLAYTYAGVVIAEDVTGSMSQTSSRIDAVLFVGNKLKKEITTRRLAIRYYTKRKGKPIGGDAWKSIDISLSLAIADMFAAGILVDRAVLEEKRDDLKGEIESVERMIYESVGHEFNINSNKQLADVLFVELSLPVQRKAKTGPSTDEGVLRKLKPLHPCIGGILTYRERMKMLNTYVEPLLARAMDSHDGRVRSTFHQTGTTTGRLSSDSPNLQNIPVRTELGREIRDVFVAGQDSVLLSADYSQIDLRVMADFSKDQAMLADFRAGIDFHSATAARIFGKKEKEVTPDERRIAKTINFGVLYGLSPFGLSKTLGIEREDAAKYISEYFEKYVRVREFLEETLVFARQNGYVETALGRRRYIPGLRSDNAIVRSASEREAINMPIQGTTADIMRAAMVDVYAYLNEQGESSGRIVLQIHDELVIECKRKGAQDVAADIKKMMENAFELSVPLRCEAKMGNSLASMKVLEI